VMEVRNRRRMTVSQQEAGLQLADWLSARYTYRGREAWTKEIREGRILTDGVRTAPDLILKRGMTVSYDPPPFPEPEVNRNYSIVYQNQDLLVVDKPQDLPSHPGGIYLHNSLVTFLKEEYGEVYLANRLDRETSGLMLVARSKAAATFFFRELKERRVVKEYLALVHGEFPGFLDAVGWLMKDEGSLIRKKRAFYPDSCAVHPGDSGSPGRQFARTEISCVETAGGYSLLRCRLHTGKMHQIRATLCSLGFPLVGDKIYGRDETIFLRFASGRMSPTDRERLVLPNQALQSSLIRFRPPKEREGDEALEFTAAPPDWLSLIKSPAV
jgi:RluA family pseudouridine synthase